MTSTPKQPLNTPVGDSSVSGVRPAGAPSFRRRVSAADSLRAVSSRLEARDYVLAQLLHDHRTLTTEQIAAILYNSVRTCRNRLAVLRSFGFIDWFHPVRPDRRRIAHWIPGPLSARYVALAAGHRPPTAKGLREVQDRIVAAASHLTHTVGTNQFFIDLITTSRSWPGTRLSRWWSASRIAGATGRRVSPDGHGVWQDDDRITAFFLEYDTGTETLATVAGKLPPYERLRASGGPAWPVLVLLPSGTRETNLHQQLAASGRRRTLTVATSTHAAARADATGPVWRLAGNGRRRYRLIDLPVVVGEAGPFHPGPPTAGEDPLGLAGSHLTS